MVKNEAKLLLNQNKKLYIDVFKWYTVFMVGTELLMLIIKSVYFLIIGVDIFDVGGVWMYATHPISINLLGDYLTSVVSTAFIYSVCLIRNKGVLTLAGLLENIKQNIKKLLGLSFVLFCANDVVRRITDVCEEYGLNILSFIFVIVSLVFSLFLFLAVQIFEKNTEKTVMDICKESYLTVRDNISGVSSFIFSFIGWYILEFAISAIVTGGAMMLIRGNEVSYLLGLLVFLVCKAISLTLCGLGFFYYPYYYTAKEGLLQNLRK